MLDPAEVRTPRLLLRRMRPQDWVLLREMDDDPDVSKTMGGRRTPAQTKAYVAAQLRHWSEHGFGWWTAFDRETSRFVGRGGVRFLQLDGERHVEVGYALLPSYWGRGLATELASAAIAVGFETLGVHRLVAITLPTNAASRRILDKLGFRHVGETVYKELPHVLYERLRARSLRAR